MDAGPRLAIAALMLAFAALSDLRRRRVANLQWAPWVLAAAAFVVADAGTDPGRGALRTYAIAAGLALAFRLLYEVGLFGGADAKALMVLAFLLPGLVPEGPLTIPAAATVLMNASLVVALLPIGFALVNAARGHVHVPAMFLGLQIPLSTARRLHVWPMQEVHDGHVRFRFGRAHAAPPTRLDELERMGLRRVWVTPKVPFMVPLLLGLGIFYLWGNALVGLLVRAMGP